MKSAQLKIEEGVCFKYNIKKIYIKFKMADYLLGEGHGDKSRNFIYVKLTIGAAILGGTSEPVL